MSQMAKGADYDFQPTCPVVRLYLTPVHPTGKRLKN